jgi:prevent-host-death family protein
MRVTTADFIRNYGRLADVALSEPVTITKNGHDRLVVISAAAYERLKQGGLPVAEKSNTSDKQEADTREAGKQEAHGEAMKSIATSSRPALTPKQRVQIFNDWVKSHEGDTAPSLADETISRVALYPDR